MKNSNSTKMLEKVEVFGRRIDSRSHWPEFWSRCWPCTEQPAADCFGKTTELSREVCWPWNLFFPTFLIFPTHHHHFKIRKQCYAALLLFETFHCTILSQGVGEDQPLHSSAFFDGQNLGIKVKVPTWAT